MSPTTKTLTAALLTLTWLGCGLPPDGTPVGDLPTGSTATPQTTTPSIQCGGGTHLEGESCVSNILACGAGTVLQGGTCVVPQPDVDFKAFVAKTSLNTAGHFLVYALTGGLEHHLKHVWTDLSLNDAKGWSTGSTVMIGTGHALHFAPETLESASYYSAVGPVVWSVNLTNTTGPDGKCLPGVVPEGKRDTVQLAFFSWNQGVATPVLCAKAGTVRITYAGSGDNITLSAVFGDGSTFEKEIYIPRSN